MDTLPPHAQNGNLKIPTTSGIYKITCTANKRIYVGSAVNLRNRRYEHFKKLRRGNHHSITLQRAFDKYGESCFNFEVLELVLIPEMLTAREQHWLDTFKPFGRKGFNTARTAGSTLGRKHDPETRKKMGTANLGNAYWIGRKHTPESREKIGMASSGRRHSPEAKAKMSQARKGKGPSAEALKNGNARIGHTVSLETREKLRQAHLGKKMSPESSEKKRQAMLGNTHNLGKKASAETREKMRQSHLARKRVETGE